MLSTGTEVYLLPWEANPTIQARVDHLRRYTQSCEADGADQTIREFLLPLAPYYFELEGHAESKALLDNYRYSTTKRPRQYSHFACGTNTPVPCAQGRGAEAKSD